MDSKAFEHYDQDYFDWHRDIGEFGARANRFKFEDQVAETDVVLDFGCGGGYLLKALPCRERLGVEVCPQAREIAEKNGLEVFETTTALEEASLDVVISNHALEHTEAPLAELREIHRKLKPSGRAVFVVPCEAVSKKYKAGDISQHLYSWSPMCLGNLFTRAGYEVISVTAIYSKWPPFYRQIRKWGGVALFKVCCMLYGQINRRWFQVKIVAVKKEHADEKPA